MSELFSAYRQRVRPELQKRFGYPNALEAPKISKIVVNVGLNVNAAKDPKFLETVRATFSRVSGQRPVDRGARKSVSSFKVRKGQVVGMMVTLRGKRMWDFLEKLIAVALPRTRDFWGIERRAVDPSGNLSIGIREHLAFPEIRSDEVERVHGLEVTIVSRAKDRQQALALYELLGVPLKAEG